MGKKMNVYRLVFLVFSFQSEVMFSFSSSSFFYASAQVTSPPGFLDDGRMEGG